MNANLMCWSCGKEREIEIAAPPQFAFEVAGWANDVGWVGVIDHRYSRSLVFCSSSCLENEKTKSGSIRARPKDESKRRQEARSGKASAGSGAENGEPSERADDADATGDLQDRSRAG